jgi:signal transduction histidine kinase/CheY-like chemotaxis protein
MNHAFVELVDVPGVQRLTEFFYSATGIPSSVVGFDGRIISGAGRQDVCARYHSTNPETSRRCKESQAIIVEATGVDRKYTVHRCKNGLIHAAAPVFVEGSHVANFLTGQFLFHSPEKEFFLHQARRFGFPETDYMRAVYRVPVIDETKLLPYLDYLTEITGLLGGTRFRQVKDGKRVKKKEQFPEARGEVEGYDRGESAGMHGVFEQVPEGTVRFQPDRLVGQAQKMKAIGTLAGGVAHDFNNILAAIVGFAEIAMNRAPEGPLQGHLHRIYEAGVRGRELVRQMLTFAGQTEPEKRPLHLPSVVKETAQLLGASLPESVRIIVNGENASGFVLADPEQIKQVIINLAKNAAEAMGDEGGSLTINTSVCSFNKAADLPHSDLCPGSYVKLVVTDTGEGIDIAVRERLFDPFFTTRKPGKGTGLGLSVALGIVENHSGAITVESEEGKGATFTVYLPEIALQVDQNQHEGQGLPAGQERILLVDDEEALIEMGQELLSELGYRVEGTTSSVTALELIRKDPSQFDLVITDQTMPNMTGIELARAILAVRPDMPVILCTGFDHLLDSASAISAGITRLVMKPLTSSEMAQTIRNVLSKENG